MLNFNLKLADNVNVAIYDQPNQNDRYTVFYEDFSVDGMNEAPFSPNRGICQEVGDFPTITPGAHLGRLVTNISELNADVVKCILQRAI